MKTIMAQFILLPFVASATIPAVAYASQFTPKVSVHVVMPKVNTRVPGTSKPPALASKTSGSTVKLGDEARQPVQHWMIKDSNKNTTLRSPSAGGNLVGGNQGGGILNGGAGNANGGNQGGGILNGGAGNANGGNQGGGILNGGAGNANGGNQGGGILNGNSTISNSTIAPNLVGAGSPSSSSPQTAPNVTGIRSGSEASSIEYRNSLSVNKEIREPFNK